MGCIYSKSVATVPMDEITIAILGINNAGKTCFLRALSGNYNFDSVPTVGFGQEHFMYDDIHLHVYDLGGNKNFRSVWARYFAETWGFVYVIDSSDKESFKDSGTALKEVINHPMMKGKPYVVVANKQDIEGAVKAQELKKSLNIEKKVQIFDAIVTKVEDEKMNAGVKNAVSTLISDICKSYEKIGRKRVSDMEEQKKIEDIEREEKLKRIAELRAKREKEQEAAAE